MDLLVDRSLVNQGGSATYESGYWCYTNGSLHRFVHHAVRCAQVSPRQSRFTTSDKSSADQGAFADPGQVRALIDLRAGTTKSGL